MYDLLLKIHKKEKEVAMIVVGNGMLFTRDSKNTFIENGAVAIEGKLIKKVGKTEDIKNEFKDAEFIDAKGAVIMPAFINVHEHIYSALARGLSINGYAPKGFLDILDGMWWTIDRHLSEDSLIKASAIATYIECIKNGCTTIFDHHASFGKIEGSLFAIEEEAKRLGVRSCLCYEISDRDGIDKADAAIEENVNFINHALKDDTDMIAGMMGMHASFTISDETMNKCAKALPSGVGYHIHVAEGIEDLHQCLKEHGKRILDRLMDFGVLRPETLTAHCIYINQHEIKLLKDTDTMMVHNPESNMGNACGCPPTLEIYKAGVLSGLGTDGYTHDMTESFKVANILHKHSLCDPTVAWVEIPDMLFDGNRKIAGRYFKNRLGVIEEGAAADVIVTDYHPYTKMNASNLNGHILFGMTGKSVVTTIANGEILMKDRVLTKVDEEAETAFVREQADKLWKSING